MIEKQVYNQGSGIMSKPSLLSLLGADDLVKEIGSTTRNISDNRVKRRELKHRAELNELEHKHKMQELSDSKEVHLHDTKGHFDREDNSFDRTCASVEKQLEELRNDFNDGKINPKDYLERQKYLNECLLNHADSHRQGVANAHAISANKHKSVYGKR